MLNLFQHPASATGGFGAGGILKQVQDDVLFPGKCRVEPNVDPPGL